MQNSNRINRISWLGGRNAQNYGLLPDACMDEVPLALQPLEWTGSLAGALTNWAGRGQLSQAECVQESRSGFGSAETGPPSTIRFRPIKPYRKKRKKDIFTGYVVVEEPHKVDCFTPGFQCEIICILLSTSRRSPYSIESMTSPKLSHFPTLATSHSPASVGD